MGILYQQQWLPTMVIKKLGDCIFVVNENNSYWKVKSLDLKVTPLPEKQYVPPFIFFDRILKDPTIGRYPSIQAAIKEAKRRYERSLQSFCDTADSIGFLTNLNKTLFREK